MTNSCRGQTKVLIAVALFVVAIVGFYTNAWTVQIHCDAPVYHTSWQDSQPNCGTICDNLDKTNICQSAFGSCADAAYLHQHEVEEDDDTGDYRCACIIACDVEDCELESCP